MENKLNNVDQIGKIDENIVLPVPEFGGGKVKIVHDVLNKNTAKEAFKELVKMTGKCPKLEYDAESTIQVRIFNDIIFENCVCLFF